MRDDDSNWFVKWEEELPSPEELIPLSQSLITPDLAVAFDLRNSGQPPPPPPPKMKPFTSSSSSPPQANSSAAEFVENSAGEARTLKRPRLVWTPQLHKRFVDAVAHLGIKNAVPKTIMQIMSVDGLTRENVASHLQKYRLYLKRMQSGGGGGNVGESDHLFASSPVPPHFLLPTTSRQNSSDHFMMPSFQQPTNQFLHRQISAASFGSPTNSSLFLASQSQSQQPLHLHNSQVANYAHEDLESVGTRTTVLTLFPSRDY